MCVCVCLSVSVSFSLTHTDLSLPHTHAQAQFDITRHITSEPTSPETNPGVSDLEAMDNTDVNVYQWKTGPNVGKIISMTDFYIMNQMDAGSLVRALCIMHASLSLSLCLFCPSH